MVLLPPCATMHSKMPAPLLLSLSRSDMKPSNMRCSLPSVPSHAISTQACWLPRRGIITSGSTRTCGGDGMQSGVLRLPTRNPRQACVLTFTSEMSNIIMPAFAGRTGSQGAREPRPQFVAIRESHTLSSPGAGCVTHGASVFMTKRWRRSKPAVAHRVYKVGGPFPRRPRQFSVGGHHAFGLGSQSAGGRACQGRD